MTGDFAGATALLIGTGTHQPGSDLPDIPAVAGTLDDLRAALLGRCGLAEVRVELDLDTPLELGSAISRAAASATGPLIVYYVGHGLVSRRGALHLAAGVTRSGPLHLEHTALPYDTMRRYLLDNVDTPVAVVLDCCFSGRAIEGMAPWDEVAGLAEITGAYVLTSAGRSEPSFAPEGLAHTAFSGALLRLLAEGDPGGRPYLTLQDVHRHLSRVLPAGGFPRPRARSTGRVGELVLAPNPAVLDARVRLSPPGLPEGSPYKGLKAFGEHDAPLFFGRERLVSALVRELAERDTPLIVTGASGAGKSSLLRAGLLPALAQGALGLPRTAAVITPGEPIPEVDVLVVDQLEEALLDDHGFDGHGFDDHGFVDEVCARGGSVVLGVRADFLGRCAGHPALRPAFKRGQVVVGPMTEQELREAIERPALASGLALEAGLAELLLRDLGTEAGRLPLLSHALLTTWQQRRAGTLTVAGYRDSGGIHGALAATADDVLAGLAAPEAARAVFRRLVHVGEGTDDTRRRVPLGELLASVPDPDAALAAVRAFSADDARLLTLDSRAIANGGPRPPPDGRTVTITHEALLTAWPTLREWVESDRDGLLVEQRLVEAATAWEGDPAGLYRGARLAVARDWASGRELAPVAGRYLAASVALEERQARRRMALVGVLGALLAVSLIASGAAVLKFRDADAQRRVAAGRALIYQADTVRQADPVTALRRGVEAVRENPGAETESALAADVLSTRYLGVLAGHGRIIRTVAVSPDGTRAITGGEDGRVLLWNLAPDPARPRRTAGLAGRGGVRDVRFSPDGRSAVVVWRDGPPQVWDLASGVTSLGAARPRHLAAEFYAGGSRVAVAGEAGVDLWTVSGRRLPVPGARGASGSSGSGSDGSSSGGSGSGDAGRLVGGGMVERLAIAGDRLLAGHRDGSATLWDLRTGRSTALPSLSIGDEPGSGVGLSPDGLVAVVGAQVWDLKAKPQRVALLAGFEGAVRDVAFLPAEPSDGTSSEGPAGGRQVITGGDQQIGMIWDVTDPARPRLRARLGGHRDTVTSVATGPGGLVVTGSLDTTAIVWRFADPPREAVKGVDGQPYGIAVGGSSLLTYDSDGGGTLRHLTDARPGPPPTSPLSRPLSRPVGRFADARRGVALSVDGTVALVGGERGAVLRDPTGSVDVARGARVSSVALSGDGRVALVGAREGLWVRAGAVTVAAGRGPVTAVAISADGTLGVTASGGRIVPWDLRDPTRPRPGQAVTGHSGEILALAVHGRTVLSGGVDKKAVLWEVGGGALRRRGTLLGQGGEVVGVRFGDDGLLALVSSLDETVGVWLVRDADAPRQVLSLSQAGSGAAFGPDRYEIFASSVRGGLYRWDLRSFAGKIDQPVKAACAMIDCGIQEGQ